MEYLNDTYKKLECERQLCLWVNINELSNIIDVYFGLSRSSLNDVHTYRTIQCRFECGVNITKYHIIKYALIVLC